MGKDVRPGTKLTWLQVQEQADTSSGTPPDYEGRITVNPILLDMGRLVEALETGGFKLMNTRVHQNLVLHHLRSSMHCSAILLCEACHMVGSPFRLAALQEISWRDLQWMEVEQRGSPVPVWEEVVEDEVTGVVTNIVLPDWAESSNEGSEESMSLVNI